MAMDKARHARAQAGVSRPLALVSTGFAGATFGFFFAWQSSTLHGLDRIDPATAIQAMQAMNASVRNPLFGTVWIGTPLLLILAAAVAAREGVRRAPWLLGLALMLHMTGVFGVTATINVPMNRALANVDPHGLGNATVWQDYSERWQSANLIRMIAAGGSLLLTAAAIAPALQSRKWS